MILRVNALGVIHVTSTAGHLIPRPLVPKRALQARPHRPGGRGRILSVSPGSCDTPMGRLEEGGGSTETLAEVLSRAHVRAAP